jgi:capsular polysaccharide biosynthesis protein
MLIAIFQEKWLILLVSLVVALSTFIYCKTNRTEVYTTSTNIYILNNNSTVATGSDFQTAELLTKDYEELIKNVVVTEAVVARLGLDMTPQKLSNMIDVSSKEDTRIIKISISHRDPYLAAQIANTVREIASVKIVDIMKIDAVNLVSEAAIPTTKSGTGAAMTALLAFAAMLVVCVTVIGTIDVLNDTIKSPDEIATTLGINSLGAIPYDKDITNAKGKSLLAEGDED